MSASDAAPLPRLGEVFFDVRGSSRSMRLSWYADTGVAVFSIWQGGKCTGTFRLPIDDLPRMVQILQRGPGGQPGRADSGAHAAGWDAGPADKLDQDFPTGSYGYPEAEHRPEAGYGHVAGPGGDAGYGEEHGRERDYGDWAYGADPGYPGPPDYRPERDYRADPDYSQDRVAPPYTQSAGDPYHNDNLGARRGDTGDFARPAYPAGHHTGPAPAGQYEDPGWRPAGYSDEQDYRLATGQRSASRHSAGRHSSQR